MLHELTSSASGWVLLVEEAGFLAGHRERLRPDTHSAIRSDMRQSLVPPQKANAPRAAACARGAKIARHFFCLNAPLGEIEEATFFMSEKGSRHTRGTRCKALRNVMGLCPYKIPDYLG